MSGPAGGVLASAALARRLDYPNVITSDMGGTSFDVGLIVDGEPLVSTMSIAGRYHLASPRIQVTAIGAGGGSIARPGRRRHPHRRAGKRGRRSRAGLLREGRRRARPSPTPT